MKASEIAKIIQQSWVQFKCEINRNAIDAANYAADLIAKDSQWISVKDRLPTKGQTVIMWNKYSYSESVPGIFKGHVLGHDDWFDLESEVHVSCIRNHPLDAAARTAGGKVKARKDGWIDLFDQTPKEGDTVLVYDSLGHMYTRIVNFEGMERYFWKPVDRGVFGLFWRSLPDPPKIK